MDINLFYSLFILVSASSCDILKNLKKKNVKFPPCEICKQLVGSFKNGIERTSRGNFAGGDTAWEEQKLGSYHKSEVRFVEIQESLCADVQDAEAQCHALAEEVEYELESWWFHEQDANPDLEEWLCIRSKKVCCEPGHYGVNCEECPGYPTEICSGHGVCEGSGSRDGSGLCKCDTGFGGKKCDHCAEKYFNVMNKHGKLSCDPCHQSCETGCSDGTPKGCISCKPGWTMDVNVGCIDINECQITKDLCKYDEVCINNEGSYVCRDLAFYGKKDPGKWVRYTTYMTFIIATGIFFRKSIMLGSCVGLIAAIYVSASELVMSDVFDMF